MANILVYYFDKTAEAARILYVYGCFSNVDFDNPEIRDKINNSLINSDAGYRKECNPLVTVLEDLIKSCRYKQSKSDKGKKQLFISPDRFDDDITGLVDIYRLKTDKSLEKPILDYIKYTYKFSRPDIVGLNKKNKDELLEYFGDDVNIDSLFFLDIGQAKFTNKELSQIYTALMFFNGKSPYSVPGFFACDRINDYLKMSGEEPASDNANVVFNYSNIDRILNDNAAYSILSAIKEKSGISFYYRKYEIAKLKKITDKEKAANKDQFRSDKIRCYPLKIMYEFQNGRGYLIAWSYHNKCIKLFRLDDIFQVESYRPEIQMTEEKIAEIESACKTFIDKLWLSVSNKNKMRITVDFDENAEVIRSQLPLGIVTPLSDNSCRLEAELMNYKDIVPFIRRFGEKAHVSKEKSPQLYEYIKHDIEEALKKYGAI